MNLNVRYCIECKKSYDVGTNYNKCVDCRTKDELKEDEKDGSKLV